MDKTINQIKSDLNEIATQHRQINSFFFGNFEDAITKDDVDYPLMTAVLVPGAIGDDFVRVSLQIVVCDKYEVDNYTQQDEVHSDCLLMLRDFYTTFKQNKFEDYLSINGEATTEPFINKGHDITAGWAMTMDLDVYDNEDWCNIPYDTYDFEND